MAKFLAGRFPAGFFDLTQDLARSLPADVIERWTGSDQTHATALRILEPFEVSGTSVASDSAGLTRLSGERTVVELLQLVNAPKEVIYACGAAIGGQPVGIWAADNTQMLYPATIAPADVLAMLLHTRARLHAECELKVGFAAHTARFFSLGGGLSGVEAERVELLAEEFTPGGEILVTEACRRAAGARFAYRAAPQLPGELGEASFLAAGPAMSLTAVPGSYPLPFPADFHAALRAWSPGGGDFTHRYRRRRAVVLLEREHEDAAEAEIRVLNELALSAALRRIAGSLLARHGGIEVKTAGPMAIYTFDAVRPAYEFACEFRSTLAAQSIQCRIGLDTGEVLEFELEDGLRDLAGMPVNRASKMAQDAGSDGCFHISPEAAAELEPLPPRARQVVLEASGLRIAAWSV